MQIKKYRLKLDFKSKFLIFLGICIFLLLLILLMSPTYKIKYDDKEITDSEISIPVNSYKMPDVETKYFGLNFSKFVTEKDNIDYNTLGEYEITYELKNAVLNKKRTIKVKIVDNEKPVITLLGNLNSDVMCSVDKYQEEGYTATDNYDGDITSKVTLTKESNKITYEVEDSSGNKDSVERNINAIDITPPNLQLNGYENTYIMLNSNYEEQGITIIDDCDSNLSDYTTDGTVDTSKVGLYIITYTAKDKHGNENSIKRYVYVYDPATSANLNGNDNGVIYLTFDDGPYEYTSQILDTLAKYNIKATFFVTGKGSDDLIKREYDEGHTVGIHTYTHQWSIYSSEDTFFNDLNLVSNRVESITGVKPTIMRFAGGSSNTISRKYNKGIMTVLTSEVLEKGYHYFDWNVSVEDAGSCAYKKNYNGKENCIMANFQNGLSKSRTNVVLMHDIKKYTADSLNNMIGYALQNGYTFAKITMSTEQIHQKVNN